MPRPRRIHITGALYYVTSRSHEEVPLCRDAKDYRTLLGYVKEYRQKFGFKLFAFCLMQNELQLCLELAHEATLSTIMHAIKTRYTKYYKRRYGHQGHLFQQRFKDAVLEKEPALLKAVSYLHLRARHQGLSDKPAEYIWSSASDYCGASSEHIESEQVAEVIRQLKHEAPHKAYEAYMLGIGSHVWDQFEAGLKEGAVGSDGFVESVKAQRSMPARPKAESIDVDSGHPEAPRKRSSVFVTASLGIAVLAMAAAIFYSRNVTAFQDAVRVLAQERTMPYMTVPVVEEPVVNQVLAKAFRPSNLAGTVWSVQFQMAGTNGNITIATDLLRFERNRVTSSKLDAQGFGSSNYQMRVKDDGMVMWETMQTGPRGELVFWRGELNGDVMTGLMTRQGVRTAQDEYIFRAFRRGEEQVRVSPNES